MKNAKIAIRLTATVTTLNAFGAGLCLNIFYEFVHLNVLQPPWHPGIPDTRSCSIRYSQKQRQRGVCKKFCDAITQVRGAENDS